MHESGRIRTVRCAAAVAALLCAHAAYGQEYSVQIAGGWNKSDDRAFETEGSVLGATYYFGGVDITRGPYALAAFLDRSSRVSAGLYAEDDRIALGTVTSAIGETNGYSVSGRYVWPASGWYVGAGFDRADTERPSTSLFRTDEEREAESLVVGKYLNGTLAVDLAVRSTATATNVQAVACPSFLVGCLTPASTRTEADVYDVGVRHVGGFGAMSYALSGRVASSDVEFSFAPVVIASPQFQLQPNPAAFYFAGGAVAVTSPIDTPTGGRFETYAVTGELFPTQRLGVRVAYSRFDGDTPLDERYEVGVTWFANPSFGIGATLGETRGGIGAFERDSDNAELRLIGRF